MKDLITFSLAMYLALAGWDAMADNRDEAFRCAEIVADELELDFNQFEVGLVNNLPEHILAAKASDPANPGYSYVFVNSNTIDTYNIDEMRVIIAHELIHVKQTQDGDLIGRNWKGKNYDHKPYAKRPHEKRAHKHDDKLAKLCA